MRRIVPLAFVCCLMALDAAAAQGKVQGKVSTPNISVNVDRQPIVQGEPFTLQISIESEGEGRPDIRLPRFSGLRILRQFESHPSSFHFSFGFGAQATNIRKETSNYSYVLVADKPGKYKIDQVVVTIGGQKFKGETYQIEVLSGQGSGGRSSALLPDPPASGSGVDDAPSEPDDPQPEVTDLDGAKVDPDYFVQTAVSKKEVFEGEGLTMTIYLYMARQISNYDILREPGTEGFWGENLVPSNQRRLSSETVTVGGRMYDRVALRKMALFPIKPGKLTIAPTIVEIEVQSGFFFSKRRAVKRASSPVTITVLELPAEQQPPGFSAANVGQFSFKAKVDTTKVKVGEPVTLTMTVRGEGNLRNLVLPELEEIDGLKIYAPETEVEVAPRGESIVGSSASRVLMIPKEAGTYTIPKIDWSYFDPVAKTYKTLSSKPYQLTVTSSGEKAAAAAPVVSARATRKAGQDRLNRQLRSILSRADLSERNPGSTLTRPWFLMLFIGVPLIYAGFALASRTRRKLAESRIRNRSKNAENEFIKRLQAVGKEQADLSTDQFFAALARCLIGFIEDRLEVKAAGDTMTELRERLVSRGFSHDQAEQVVTEMETCDFARFAKGAGQEAERRQARERVERLVGELAKVKVTPPPKKERR
jgi:hypothetical protein